MRKIIKWIKKLIWWRFYYTKTKLTTEEANRGRCLLCHARCGNERVINKKNIYNESLY